MTETHSIPRVRSISDAAARINAGDLAGARAILKSALQTEPRHPVALYLMGYIEFEARNWRSAEAFLRHALAEAPTETRVILLLVRTLQADGRGSAALALLQEACRKSPNHELHHQLGVTLKLQHRYEEALVAMNVAWESGHLDPAKAMERANLLGRLSRFHDAIETYEALLDADPSDLHVHALLNDIYCALERSERIGASYDKACTRVPNAFDLRVAQGYMFLKMHRAEQAERAFRRALEISPSDPSALAGLGQALEKLGEEDDARAIHARNSAINSRDSAALEAWGSFLLRHGDARRAIGVLQDAVRSRPASQSGLALLGLAQRACNSAEEAWLNDYERDVRLFDLEPPEGYSNMDAFNAELAAYLRELHAGARQYPSQTLRGGTQTYEQIFYNGHHLIDRLLDRINAAIRVYGQGLAGRTKHPFATRLGPSFRHSGSWSSCLKDRGFHVNHIHQKGWISACYYVAVPDAAADAESKQGWLKFGEPPEEFGLNMPPRQMIRPQPGRLVLFPSYFWHGTSAFVSPQDRMTIAFDTLPA